MKKAVALGHKSVALLQESLPTINLALHYPSPLMVLELQLGHRQIMAMALQADMLESMKKAEEHGHKLEGILMEKQLLIMVAMRSLFPLTGQGLLLVLD